MAKFVKKAALDRYPEVSSGQSDPSCTHVLLTKKEYSELLGKLSTAEQETRTVKHEADRTIAEAKRNAEYKARQAAQEAQKAVQEMEGELEAERVENAHQRALNANLLRVARERANAERGLRPKKQHTGYGVVRSGEKEYSYKDASRRWRKEMLWETVVQSPYEIDMPEEVVRRQITEDLLRKNEDGECLIYKLGIDRYYPDDYSTMVEDQRWSNDSGLYNVMMKPRFQANGRYGYWEVIFLHTKPIGVVPKELRLR